MKWKEPTFGATPMLKALTTANAHRKAKAFDLAAEQKKQKLNYPDWAQTWMRKYKEDWYIAQANGDEVGMRKAQKLAEGLRSKLREMATMPKWAQEQMQKETVRWMTAEASGNIKQKLAAEEAGRAIRGKIEGKFVSGVEDKESEKNPYIGDKVPDKLHKKEVHNTSHNTLKYAELVGQEVVGTFEGGAYAIAGNYDGAGLSLGWMQLNLKNNLHEVLNDYANSADTKDEFNSIFNFSSNGRKASAIMREMVKADQKRRVSWGNSISKPPKKKSLYEPWNSAFRKLVKSDNFQLKYTESPKVKGYHKEALRIMEFIGMKTVRGYVLSLDISVNNGSTKKKLVDEVMSGGKNWLIDIHDEHFKGRDPKDKEVVKDLLNRLSKTKDPVLKKAYLAGAAAALQKIGGFSWDSWSRKVAIIEGKGVVHKSNFSNAKLTDESIHY
ncbi:hypothetical protein [Paenibacillus sp. FSL R10-2748]|uniref:hypothetical protein n=1 Tax=Paenibacillus sp. FSL R10-2748 TaxID=2954658 RepID=UPI0030FB2223